MAYENLDLKEAYSFGYMRNPNKDWVDIAEASVTKGWKHVDVGAMESGMAENVAGSYRKIATFYVSDPDTDYKWTVSFDNDSALWELTLDGQPDVEVLPEQKKEFFQSELMKKIAKQAAEWMLRGKKIYDEVIKPHLEHGELMKVEPAKLTAILFWLEDPRGYWMQNFRSLKFRF